MLGRTACITPHLGSTAELLVVETMSKKWLALTSTSSGTLWGSVGELPNDGVGEGEL